MAAPDATSLFNAAGASGVLLDSIFKTAAVGNILTMVNVVILAAGTAWLTWNILAGITQSAWDGEFLGKRFHTLWMPIRNALGFAMLIPAFAGWGAAQLILYQSAKIGTGAANIAITGGAGAYLTPKASDFIKPVETNYFPQVNQVYERHLCRERAKIRAKQMADPSAELGGSAADWEKFVDLAGCGDTVAPPNGALKAAHTSAMQALDVTLQALATGVAAGLENEASEVPRSVIQQQLRGAALAYKIAIDAAVKAEIESRINKIAGESTHGDWLGFGYRTVAAAQAAREVNSATGDTGGTTGNSNQGSAGREAAATTYTYGDSNEQGEFQTGAGSEVRGAGVIDMIKSAPATLLKVMFGGANVNTLTGDGGDLIAALQGIGTSLINWGGVAIAAIFGIMVILGLATTLSLGAALPIAMWIIGLALIILTPLFAMGITLAAYIPLVPAIFWSLAVLGWLLTVAEALFMAPLWAFIHLETEGEGMGQKTEKGYAFIMNLMLRPLVLVFTFTIASMLLNVVWAMLGTHISNAMKSTNMFSFSGIAIMIGLCFVLVATATMMIYKVYGTAIGLADAIPAWLGTNFHNYTSGLEQSGGFGHGGDVGGGVSSRVQGYRNPIQGRNPGSDTQGSEPAPVGGGGAGGGKTGG